MMRVVDGMLFEDAVRGDLAEHRRSVDEDAAGAAPPHPVRLLERRLAGGRVAGVVPGLDVVPVPLVVTAPLLGEAAGPEMGLGGPGVPREDRTVAGQRRLGVGRFA